MARKEAALGCFALAQQLEKEYWSDGDAVAVDAARDGNLEPLLGAVVTRLFGAGMKVAEAHAIVHDQDDREVWNESECALVVERKALHVHMAVKFEPKEGGTLAAIAKAVGLEPQYIEKAGKGRYGWDNLMSYLIHAKDEDKHQYSPDAVVWTSIIASMPGISGGVMMLSRFTGSGGPTRQSRPCRTGISS